VLTGLGRLLSENSVIGNLTSGPGSSIDPALSLVFIGNVAARES
jgi:hypothetical protein